MKTWNFWSTCDDFDGKKILSDAKEAGLKCFELNRKEKYYLFINQKMFDECCKLGIEPSIYSGSRVFPAIWQGEIVIELDDELISDYYVLSPSNTSRLYSFITDFYTIKNRKHITTVAGYDTYEEDNLYSEM